jgi:hypothetical protein
MEVDLICQADCTKRTISICGDNLDYIIQKQNEYKTKHRRNLSIERAINQIISEAREKLKQPC